MRVRVPVTWEQKAGFAGTEAVGALFAPAVSSPLADAGPTQRSHPLRKKAMSRKQQKQPAVVGALAAANRASLEPPGYLILETIGGAMGGSAGRPATPKISDDPVAQAFQDLFDELLQKVRPVWEGRCRELADECASQGNVLGDAVFRLLAGAGNGFVAAAQNQLGPGGLQRTPLLVAANQRRR